jgi:hypothetical protein
VNARSTPERVGNAHAANQVSCFLRNGVSAESDAALPSPIEAESLAMPGDDGGWFDDDEC